MIEVYNFEQGIFDRDDYAPAAHKSTAERISRIEGARIIPVSAELVDESRLDDDGRYDPSRWPGLNLMPKGPRGESRPADLIGAAVKVMRIATGEEEDEREAASSAGAQLGKLGGEARARRLTPEQKTEIAKKAALSRWRRS